MLKFSTLFWEVNYASHAFSSCYDVSWVTKLYDGVKRHLTRPYQFVLFTDRKRDYGDRDILQVLIETDPPSYAACIEPYRLNDPMILVGLDTVITGNIDHLADYCLTASSLALPADPFNPAIVCNGVALVPSGCRDVYDRHEGQNDMDWMRVQRFQVIDELFPGHVVSYKGHVKEHGLGDSRIVYFHGYEKPHELPDVEWIGRHWRVDEGESNGAQE